MQQIEVICYLIAFLIVAVVLFFSAYAKTMHLRILYFVDISTVLVFVYIVVLVIYFKSYYMGRLDVYPSAVIAKWWFNTLLFFVLPMNFLYLLYWVIRKFRK